MSNTVPGFSAVDLTGMVVPGPADSRSAQPAGVSARIVPSHVLSHLLRKPHAGSSPWGAMTVEVRIKPTVPGDGDEYDKVLDAAAEKAGEIAEKGLKNGKTLRDSVEDGKKAIGKTDPQSNLSSLPSASNGVARFNAGRHGQEDETRGKMNKLSARRLTEAVQTLGESLVVAVQPPNARWLLA